MKLKVLFLLNCESSKYIAKIFSLSILSCCMIAHIFNDKNEVAGDINSLNLLVFSGMTLRTKFYICIQILG